MKTLSRINKIQGFSLIELMVALVIGLIIMGAVILLFSNTKQGYDVQEDLAAIQENGRYAIRVFADDLRLAGYLGYLNTSDKLTTKIYGGTVTAECTSNFVDMSEPLLGKNANSATADASTASPSFAACIPSADYKLGTDILVVRHANPIPTTSYDSNTLYLHTELEQGDIFKGAYSVTGSESEPYTNHAINVHVYYIRPYAVIIGDDVPTLVREVLVGGTGGPKMQAEIIAEGVENMQILYGLDTSVPGDNIVDAYVTAAGVTDWKQVMVVRIDLLVRAPSVEGHYTNSNAYPSFGDYPIAAANDKYRRRIFTTSVHIRNHRKLGT